MPLLYLYSYINTAACASYRKIKLEKTRVLTFLLCRPARLMRALVLSHCIPKGVRRLAPRVDRMTTTHTTYVHLMIPGTPHHETAAVAVVFCSILVKK